MTRAPDTLRNVAFLGLSKSGKTTLLEYLLGKTGAIARPGKVDEGTSVLDHDEHARERRHTVDATTAFFEHDGVLVNAIDTPGFRDFVGQVFGVLVAVEAVVFCVDADEGVRPHTRKLWQYVEAKRLPRLVVISRLDRDSADYARTLAQIQEQLDSKCVPLTVPAGDGVEFTFGPGKGGSEAAATHGEAFMEAVVESDEAMLEKYLSGEEIAPAELDKQVAHAVQTLNVFPVFAVSAEKEIGTAELLDAIVRYTPLPSTTLGRRAHPVDDPAGELEFPSDPAGPLCAFVFRTISDPFVGKLTLVRVFSGELAHNGPFINPHTGKSDKFGKLVRLQGKEQVPVDAVGAGDIVALLKLESLKTFDTLSSGDLRIAVEAPSLPHPMHARTLVPKTRVDEKKFSESLHKVLDEDPSLGFSRDARTGEIVVAAASQLHLQLVTHRLKARYHVEVNVKDPKVPYLETISGSGDDRYRHKKQSGGAGEFAEVALRIEPLERGKGFEFANEVFGGAIAESYVQSAFKGVKAVLEEGAVAGYPMVDMKVSVYDGKEHPVDSKDVAFQKAGREAFKSAVMKAKPVLLEPIVNLEVTFPAEVVGDITGDLNRRRARVQGMDSEGEFQTIRAQTPLSELTDYSNALGAMTAGQGSYDIEMSHYEVTPMNVQQKVITESKAAEDKHE